MIWSKRYNEVKSVAEALMGKKIDDSRNADNILMKMAICYVMSNEGAGEVSIASAVGKDHSTVNYYKKKVKEMMDAPQSFRTQVKYIMDLIKLA